MEIITNLWENIEVIIASIGGVVALASVITVGTDTPPRGSKLYRPYRIVEWLALNVGKAKQEPK